MKGLNSQGQGRCCSRVSEILLRPDLARERDLTIPWPESVSLRRDVAIPWREPVALKRDSVIPRREPVPLKRDSAIPRNNRITKRNDGSISRNNRVTNRNEPSFRQIPGSLAGWHGRPALESHAGCAFQIHLPPIQACLFGLTACLFSAYDSRSRDLAERIGRPGNALMMCGK